MSNLATSTLTPLQTSAANLALLQEALNAPTPDDHLKAIADKLDRQGVLLAAGYLQKNDGIKGAPAYLQFLNETKNPVESAFNLFFGLLTMRQQALFHATGVFASQADFTAEALFEVWGGEIFDASTREGLERDLNGMVPALLHYDPATRRYRLPESLRQLAGQRLSQSGGKQAYHARHLQYYRRYVNLWRQGEPILKSDVDQCHHAFMWAGAFATDQVLPFVLGLCEMLTPHLQYHVDIRRWLDNVLTVGKKMGEKWGTPGEMRALGAYAAQVQHFKVAKDLYYRALLLQHAANSIAGQAQIFKELGDLSVQEHQFSAAKDFYFKALLMYETVGFKLGQANTQIAIGHFSQQNKDLAAAHEHYQKAFQLYDQLDLPDGRARVLQAQGDLAAKQGNRDAAHHFYDRARQVYEQIGFWIEQADILLAIGHLYPPQQAQHYYEQAFQLYERAGSRLGMANALRAQGNLALHERHISDAASFFNYALELTLQIHAAAESAALYQLLAHLQVDLGYPLYAIDLMWAAVKLINEQAHPVLFHELKQRFKNLAQNLGDEFVPMWMEATDNTPLPDWLQPPPPELVNAVKSPEALMQAMQENDRALLEKLTPLAPPDRLAWLTAALELTATVLDQPMVHNYRALLYKELASVPGQNMSKHLESALSEFLLALETQADQPHVYAKTQNRRVALLRDMAGLPGENRPARLYEALEGCDAALLRQQDAPLDYAITQLHRANLLRELAGLKGERDRRSERIYEAHTAYQEVLARVPENSIEHATVQTNLASLFQEIANLPDEDTPARLKEALKAALTAIQLAEQHEDQALLRTARRMLDNVREAILAAADQKTFDKWVKALKK